MKSNKEINKAIASLLGEPELYDVREDLRIVKSGFESKEEATGYIFHAVGSGDDQSNRYTITSSVVENYSGDAELALYAAKRIAEKNECTFVLSLESGTWKAAFGNWGDCVETSGSNPAHVTCVSVLKYLGKL